MQTAGKQELQRGHGLLRVWYTLGQGGMADSLVSGNCGRDVQMENGHPKARLEKFDEEDWADWLFEHNPQVVREAERERQYLRDGQGVAWAELEAWLDDEDSET
jgi:hypothetical protein